jgi:hypothetical protein
MKLIKFTNSSVGYDHREYIIQNNDSIYFDFTQELNGFYFVSIYFDKLRYTFKHCKRLSENQKNLFITNYYEFINNSKKGILDINYLIESLSNENFIDE